MKKILTTLGVALLAFTALAALPTFKTITGTGTTGATNYFGADPNSQVRVVSCVVTSDLASSTLTFKSGTTAYAIVATNALSSSVTNQITSTNGLSANAVLVLDDHGSNYSAVVSSFNTNGSVTNAAGGTNFVYNVVLTSGGFAVNTTVGDSVYLMASSASIPCGATTLVMNGDAIYVGNYGRPVSVAVTGTSACSLNAVSAHYDSQSQ